jgi:hypothetical protein
MSKNIMPENTFDILFTGDIADGVDITTVKLKAAQLFRLDDAKLVVLFSGKRTILKKNINNDAAQKYQKILKSIGMITVLKSHGVASVKPSSTPVQIPSANVNPSVVSPLPAREPSQSQAEILASASSRTSSQAASQTPLSAHWNVLPVGELALSETSLAAEDVSAQSDSVLKDADWIIDELGVQLSGETNNVESDITLPNITIAPPATDLLNDDEKKTIVVPLELSAIEGITISMVGDDLLSETEKTSWTELSIDISHLDTGQEGDDLLADHEKTVFVEKTVETTNIQLITDE